MVGKVIRKIAGYLPFNWLRCQVFRLGGAQIGQGTKIARSVTIGDNTELGNYVRVSQHVFIGKNVKIGDNNVIGEFAHIGDKVILANKVTIGSNSYISNATIGESTFIESFVRFTGFQEGKIAIGKDTYIGLYAVLDWSGNMEIGDGVHIAGPSVGIWTHTSAIQCLAEDTLENHSRKKVGSVKIGSHTYIGGNSTIYPSVTIGHHSIVLPNTAVDDNVEDHLMVGGVPTKVIRIIEEDNQEVLFKHLNV